jgi:hypothetical protein
VSAVDPWEVCLDDAYDRSYARRNAVKRGLESLGFSVTPIKNEDDYDPEDHWPEWAVCVYYAVQAAYEVDAIRTVAESSPDVRDAVEAAHLLGGSNAVGQFVLDLCRFPYEAVYT